MITLTATLIYLAFIVVHDVVPLYPLNDLEATQAQPRRVRVATFLGNTLPVVVLVVIAALFPSGPLPLWASIYAGFYIVAFLVLVWLSWYQPYFFGTTAEREAEARREYGRTIQVLPDHAGRVRPNLMHLILHGLFLAVAILFVLRIVS